MRDMFYTMRNSQLFVRANCVSFVHAEKGVRRYTWTY